MKYGIRLLATFIIFLEAAVLGCSDKHKKQFEKLMSSHPCVLFVSSAGNDYGHQYSGRDMDQIDFPSGIVADNLLVVGFLSKDDNISLFSNIPTGDIRAVYFHGQNKDCIYPTHMLSIPEEYLSTLPSLLDNLLDGNESYRSVATFLQMSGSKGILEKDGTSFSAALAAHACAKLWTENRKMSASDIIGKIKKKPDMALRTSFYKN